MDDLLLQTKLAARLHDPVEKALILMRTSESHDSGTSKGLRERLGLSDLSARATDAVKRADHWASAADRAAFPNRDTDGHYPAWQRVRFDERPVIIHPLTGQEIGIGKLSDIQPAKAKELALGHFGDLIHEGDLERTALAFWRFGPEVRPREAKEIKAIKSLWRQLPADSRVPDHTIHDHLDLTCALAGAFVSDPDCGPALLAVSLGPVQEFISAARSTSDLWAGSHLLSRLAWEAMKVVCEALGPEAILFPRLRGVPQIDLWLCEEMGLRAELFEHCDWTKSASDANPLFAAALPNRFTALVPAKQIRPLANEITQRVREWVVNEGAAGFRRLLRVARMEDDPGYYGYRQIREQLADFPEVHWAAVPWSLVGSDADGKVDASDGRLADAMQPFFESSPPGYLGSRAWGLLSGGLELEAGWFWKPNPGTLYPALHELLERSLAAAKGARHFRQTAQLGWRDSLSGEAEWLTTDPAQLNLPPGQRIDTLWTKVAAARPGWATRGEHLSALNTLKRLWPTLFLRELGGLVERDFKRFVVSTHTMALATSLTKAIEDGRELPRGLREAVLEDGEKRFALPYRLERVLRDHPDGAALRCLPGWLDRVREVGDESAQQRADALLKDYLGHNPETYYALLLMDGDRMGAWLSADPDDSDISRRHRESFHPQIQAGLQQFTDDRNFVAYADEKRAPSPSRHMTISEALNHFALRLAPAVVERLHHGRVIYAGGDDLMAMLPVIDMLPAMAGLRAAFSGVEAREVGAEDLDIGFRKQANGFVMYRDELLRLMGDKATASCGAVIAHHQAPLNAVLRELREAEQRAKSEGGRDAFSISIVKRSGGALRLTAKWGQPLRLLIRLRAFLAEPDVSRRAVYNSATWLRDVPEPEGDGEMVATLLTYQLERQTGKKTTADYHNLPGLAKQLVAEAIGHVGHRKRLTWLENFLAVAEFLARVSRNPDAGRTTGEREDAA